jgi:hypothetical protein
MDIAIVNCKVLVIFNRQNGDLYTISVTIPKSKATTLLMMRSEILHRNDFKITNLEEYGLFKDIYEGRLGKIVDVVDEYHVIKRFNINYSPLFEKTNEAKKRIVVNGKKIGTITLEQKDSNLEYWKNACEKFGKVIEITVHTNCVSIKFNDDRDADDFHMYMSVRLDKPNKNNLREAREKGETSHKEALFRAEKEKNNNNRKKYGTSVQKLNDQLVAVKGSDLSFEDWKDKCSIYGKCEVDRPILSTMFVKYEDSKDADDFYNFVKDMINNGNTITHKEKNINRYNFYGDTLVKYSDGRIFDIKNSNLSYEEWKSKCERYGRCQVNMSPSCMRVTYDFAEDADEFHNFVKELIVDRNDIKV